MLDPRPSDCKWRRQLLMGFFGGFYSYYMAHMQTQKKQQKKQWTYALNRRNPSGSYLFGVRDGIDVCASWDILCRYVYVCVGRFIKEFLLLSNADIL